MSTHEQRVLAALADPTRRAVHRHLERLGEGFASMRDAVARGWNLDRYTEVAGA